MPCRRSSRVCHLTTACSATRRERRAPEANVRRQRRPPRVCVPTPATQTRAAPTSQTDALRTTYSEWKSGSQVTGEGKVTKLLADDNEGSRHQRFILTLSSGQT